MAIVKAFDTSRWNHTNDEPIDFEVAYAAGYRIWAGRASVGNYYIDPWFRRDFDAARAAGFICLPYHVTTPEYSDAEQVAKFHEALDGRIPDGIVIDAELHRNQTPARVTACNRYHAEAFDSFLPNRVLFYTNQAFGNTYLQSNFGLPLFVANPGPGGGMNYSQSPALPRLWNGFIAWQKDWKHAIPGVPDTTTDYSEFQMSEAEAREFFWMDDDQEEGDDMSELSEKIDQVLDNLATILSNLDAILDAIAALEIPEEPEPPVPPAPTYQVRVKRSPGANAFIEVGRNAKKNLPILQMLEPRVQYAKDRVLAVTSSEPLDVDGTYDFYRIAGSAHYLRADQVERI